MEDFGKLAGLYLNVKKTKAIWLGKWMNNKNKPLKILGLSQLVYLASNLTVPQGTADLVKTKLFRFLWINKKDKIKRSAFIKTQIEEESAGLIQILC